MLTTREYFLLISLLDDLTDEEYSLLMDQKLDFSNGGTAVVMVGHTGMVDEFKTNPRVKFIECQKVKGDELESLIPSNTKAVIITDGLPTYHQTWIFSWCKRKNILYLIRKSNQAIYETLKGWFSNGSEAPKVSQEEAQESFTKGKLNVLIPFIDFSKSNSENGRILERKAAEMGIKTTLGSVTQLVANQRRKSGHGDVPRSTRSKLDISVELFDRMIEDLQGMRDFLIETTEENRILRQKVEQFKKLLSD